MPAATATGRPRKYASLQVCPCGALGECVRPKGGEVYFRPVCASCRKARIKREVLAHYGRGVAACVSCGFANIDALCIDHVHDDGALHRAALGGGRRGYGGGMYYWLRARGYPTGFQTLCLNCNGMKQMHRVRQDTLANRTLRAPTTTDNRGA